MWATGLETCRCELLKESLWVVHFSSLTTCRVEFHHLNKSHHFCPLGCAERPRPEAFYNATEFCFVQSCGNRITFNGTSAWLYAVWKQGYDFYDLVGCELLTASLFPPDWKSNEWDEFSAKCISKVSLVLESSFITSTMRALSQPFLRRVDRSCHWLLIWDEVSAAAGEVVESKKELLRWDGEVHVEREMNETWKMRYWWVWQIHRCSLGGCP